ncbi:MAG: surface presentation of antigen protein [Massilia sp.]|nr:surface presentation of antigen protein [Massilia sp.]
MTVLSITAPHQVLDPTLLGRPVHLLPTFAAQLRDDLAQALRLPANRRNWGPFHVDAAAFVRAGAATAGQRWLRCAVAGGVLGFRLERGLLLAVLNHRYGQNTTAAAATEGQDDAPAAKVAEPRVTATEERLALALGQQLAAVLARRVGHNLGSADAGGAVNAGPGAAPAQGGWLLEVTLADSLGGAAGRFWFALDQPLMTAILRGLLPTRHTPATPPSVRPLASRLQVSLSGRLMSKEILLGSLFDLQVGDIIPVSLNRTDVLLDHSRLFTAAVTEHKGKLCLTAFEDAD